MLSSERLCIEDGFLHAHGYVRGAREVRLRRIIQVWDPIAVAKVGGIIIGGADPFAFQ